MLKLLGPLRFTLTFLNPERGLRGLAYEKMGDLDHARDDFLAAVSRPTGKIAAIRQDVRNSEREQAAVSIARERLALGYAFSGTASGLSAGGLTLIADSGR